MATAYWHVLFQAQQKKNEQKVEKTTVWLKGLFQWRETTGEKSAGTKNTWSNSHDCLKGGAQSQKTLLCL